MEVDLSKVDSDPLKKSAAWQTDANRVYCRSGLVDVTFRLVLGKKVPQSMDRLSVNVTDAAE